MKPFEIQFSWVDPESARGPELRATWATFKILVNGEIVTRHENQLTRAISDDLIEPLYPLAEWMSLNWWALQAEPENPERARQPFAHRHNLHYVGDGYPWPNMEIKPANSLTTLAWRAVNRPECRLRFLETNAAIVKSNELRGALEDFISAVIGRLESENVTDTLLQQEWRAIQETDEDEVEFCMAAARLGLDPYDMPRKTVDQIVRTDGILGKYYLPEFLACADASRIEAQTREIQEAAKRLQSARTGLTALPDIRKKMKPNTLTAMPWDQGYDLARQFRSTLGLNGEPMRKLSDVGRALHASSATLDAALIEAEPSTVYDALLGATASGAPGVVVAKELDPSKKFAACRAIGDYLGGADESYVSSAHTERQQFNRAFAAEFLAPAKLLKKCVPASGYLTAEGVEAIAHRFGVSEMTIQHQVENHRLAEIRA